MKKERIPELDLLRGVSILGMIAVHFLYDLKEFGGIPFEEPPLLQFLGAQGHLLFILLSGICVTLGSRPFLRGLQVFACGLLVSYVTLYMEYLLGYAYVGIWFGILHFLGFSMMVYPLFGKLKAWVLLILGLLGIALGPYVSSLQTSSSLLLPLGIWSPEVYPGSDYFPVFPNFGWFLLGAFLGKTIYREQKSLLPGFSRENLLLNFLCFLGRNSLAVYLLHQPILFLLTKLLT